MLGRDTSGIRSSDYIDDQNLELETVVPMTIDPDTSLYSKSIHKVNCTPVGRSPHPLSHRQHLN